MISFNKKNLFIFSNKIFDFNLLEYTNIKESKKFDTLIGDKKVILIILYFYNLKKFTYVIKLKARKAYKAAC